MSSDNDQQQQQQQQGLLLPEQSGCPACAGRRVHTPAEWQVFHPFSKEGRADADASQAAAS